MPSPAPDNPRPADQWVEVLYSELRSLAISKLGQERADHTLQPTALVHEAYLRLADLDSMEFRDRTHFLGAAAAVFRRVLVDHARSRNAPKRGGGWRRLTLSGLEGNSGDGPLDLLSLDEALGRLDGLDDQMARVVELRFFGGLTIEQTATVLGVGTTSVKEKWEFARAWLRREMLGGEL